MAPDDEDEEDGAAMDLDSQRKGKCVVLKTTTRQTIFLPIVGLVDADKLKPGDLVSEIRPHLEDRLCMFKRVHAYRGWAHACNMSPLGLLTLMHLQDRRGYERCSI